MTHPFVHRRLGEILVESGAIAAPRLEAALLSPSGRIGETLVSQGDLPPGRLARALADQYGLPYVDLAEFIVSPELFEHIPAIHAYRLGIVPCRAGAGWVGVAVSDPANPFLTEDVQRLSGRAVRLVVSSAPAIEAALQRSKGSAAVLDGVARSLRPELAGDGATSPSTSIALGRFAAADSPIVTLVNTMLMAALSQRASDIHVETDERGIAVKYRIDGVLYPATANLDRRHHREVVSRLKVMSDLDIAEQRVPQDGRFQLNVEGRDIDFRVSILPSAFGEDVVIRVLDKSAISDEFGRLNLDSLGLAPDFVKKFRHHIRAPYGMVLITGPTGSGKTTTLYAALNELNTGAEKIVTIEDPVEYLLKGVVQIPVNEKKNLTFARGLRSILRHDPDKIMIGEIRDAETAQIAVQSALTGHLVFTTVHANNAFDVIGRFSHMGIDIHGFVSALNCVIAQRLVRKICPSCRREARYGAALLEQSALDPRRYVDHAWAEGAGCSQCFGTGYRGRSAITEFLDLSLRIRELISERRPIAELKAAAAAEGMLTLRHSALAKALAGETTLSEVNRVTFVE